MKGKLTLSAVAFLTGAMLVSSGCTINKKKYTSGLVGCPESKIEVVEASGGVMANTWTAECNGKTFYCTYRGAGRVNCSESIVE